MTAPAIATATRGDLQRALAELDADIPAGVTVNTTIWLDVFSGTPRATIGVSSPTPADLVRALAAIATGLGVTTIRPVNAEYVETPYGTRLYVFATALWRGADLRFTMAPPAGSVDDPGALLHPLRVALGETL